jgi:hypothetical protein
MVPVGGEEAESLYRPANAIGAPPGKTTPGARTRGAATESTETPGSANFNFGLDVVSLPGRGIDLDVLAFYNSRLWNKSGTSPNVVMTYNIDAGWPAPGFTLGYGYLEEQSSTQQMLTEPNGTRHRLTEIPVGSGHYQSFDSSFISFTMGVPPTAKFPDGTKIQYGAYNINFNRLYPIKIIDRPLFRSHTPERMGKGRAFRQFRIRWVVTLPFTSPPTMIW